MKKIIVCFTLALLLCLSLFANKTNVLVYPHNDEISFILNYFFEDFQIIKEKQSYDENVLYQGDILFLDYVSRFENAQIILIPRISEIQNFIHLQLYYYNNIDKTFKRIFERIEINSKKFDVESALEIAKNYYNKDYYLITLENAISGSTYTLDSKLINSYNDNILVEQGEHTLLIQREGYIDKIVIFNAQDKVIDCSLEETLNSSLTINSHPIADVYLENTFIGQTPIKIENQSLPFSLKLEAEGYRTENITILRDQDKLNVHLKPTYLGSLELQKNAKEQFYKDISRTLGIFGLKILFGTFNDGQNKFLNSIDMATSGILVLSITDCIASLVDYYKHSVYVTP